MKSAMSGQHIPILSKLFSSYSIYREYKKGKFGNALAAIESHKQLIDMVGNYINKPVHEMNVLDIGCGQTATQTALFAADGANVTGIDMEVPTYKLDLRTFIRVIANNGLERAVKSLVRHILFDKRYFESLFSSYGRSVCLDKLDTRIMSALNLDFPDSYFDFIYSAWVFEHIDNVAKAVQEINRVLHPSGIAWIGIHLFPSLSGGHHLSWGNPDEAPAPSVPPWDHLLENRFKVNTYLNGLKLSEYREIFSRHVDIISETTTEEGEKYLTPEIEELLNARGYSREDLLTRTVNFMCKKRN
jgi:SAM-dependent methyltransferase